MYAFRISILFALFVFPGCQGLQYWAHNNFTVGPNFSPPEVFVAKAWIEGERFNSTIQEVQNEAWWMLFKDPLLTELAADAFEQNLSLQAATLRIRQARVLRDLSGLNGFPQLQEAFGRYTRNQVSLSGINAGQGFGFDRITDNYSSGFDVSWELDIWGKVRREVEASQGKLHAEIYNYDDLLVTLMGDVAEAYISLRSFDQRLKLAHENVRIQGGSLKIAKSRFDEQLASELDFYQAKTNLAQTKARIPALREGRRSTLNRLAVLLGTTPKNLESRLEEDGRIPVLPKQVSVGIPAELLRRRPDVRRAEKLVAIQNAEIGVAETDLYPAFTLSGNLGWNSQNFDDLFSSASSVGGVTPGFRWKILNYGRLKRNIELQKLQHQESITNYQQVVLLAHQEAEDAIAKFLRSGEQVTDLKESVTAAKKAVDLAKLQYKEGQSDFSQVFLLEAVLVGQQDALVEAQANTALGLIRIYKSLGGGWQTKYWKTNSSPVPSTSSSFKE